MNGTGCGQLPERRRFLAESWSWLRWLAGLAFLYPLVSFLAYRAPRQPKTVRVHKELPLGGFHLEHDFILFAEASGPWAVSRKCSHLGCRLNYQEKEGVLLCPCHQSRFTRTGVRVSGPARRNLPRFPVVAVREGGEGKGYLVSI